MQRFLTLCTFILLVVVLNAVAFAQETPHLPAVETSSEPRVLTITLDKPVNFGAINPLGSFSWTHIGAASYTIKFKILISGTVLTWRPQMVCATFCTTTDQPAELFALGLDGNDVDWSVSGKVAGIKYISATRRGILNEVQGVTGLTPAHFSEPYRDDVTILKWNHDDINKKYVVTLKVASTGAVVLKQPVQPGTSCWDSVPYDLCQISINPISLLKKNTIYTWTLKSVGFTGEKTKSGPFVFTTKGDKP